MLFSYGKVRRTYRQPAKYWLLQIIHWCLFSKILLFKVSHFTIRLIAHFKFWKLLFVFMSIANKSFFLSQSYPLITDYGLLILVHTIDWCTCCFNKILLLSMCLSYFYCKHFIGVGNAHASASASHRKNCVPFSLCQKLWTVSLNLRTHFLALKLNQLMV